MSSLLMLWWIWAFFAIALITLEVLISGYVFIGFALGAAVTSALLLLGFALSLPALMVVFALASLLAWLALRHVFKVKKRVLKTFDYDIND